MLSKNTGNQAPVEHKGTKAGTNGGRRGTKLIDLQGMGQNENRASNYIDINIESPGGKAAVAEGGSHSDNSFKSD